MKGSFIIGMVVAVSLVLVFVALAPVDKNTVDKNLDSSKPVVLSSFTILADMVAEVGGDEIISISLTKPGINIHGYEPTPSDMLQAAKADLFFSNGLNLEQSWVTKLLSNLPEVDSYVLSEGVEAMAIAEGDYEGKPNPHAWVSPAQGLIYVENIRQALVKTFPDKAEQFNQNAEVYSEKISALDEMMSESLSSIPDAHKFLVTCEGAFSYLTRDYGLQEVYIWPINDEAGGTPQQVSSVIEAVKKYQIPTVFCESTVSDKVQKEIAAATGAKYGGVLFVDTLSEAGGEADSYLALLQNTATVITNGLGN